MTHPEYPAYSLGLDIGMASVGAALLTNSSILGLHVRTFDKAETAKEGESLNKIRRDARLIRRRIRRRAHRLLRARRLFKRVGLLTNINHPQLTTSPWQLRSEGLDRLLTNEEFASVLYHLIKHRGFQSNRKSEIAEDEKAGQMLSGVSANQQRMQEKGYRTLGEMAWKNESFAQAKRNKGGDYSHTFARADLEQECHTLFRQQRQLGNSFASAEFEAAMQKLLLDRKPTLSGDNLLKMVGKCTFEPSEYRAPKASFTAEKFVWLTRLNNLRITALGETRALTDAERNLVFPLPYSLAKLTYKQVRSKLDLTDTQKFVGLSYFQAEKKDPEAATLFEAKHFHKLHKKYKEAGLEDLWQRDALDSERLDKLAYALTVFKDDTEASKWMTAQDMEPIIIDAVLKTSFSEFVRLSIKALQKIIPFMEQGIRYDEAVIKAGYKHHSQLNAQTRSRLIPKISKDDIANPVVYRAINQARKLVNAIVREYGPPSEIHIELARDLNKPFDERKRIERDQKEFKVTKDKYVKDFEDHFHRTPRGLELTKWRLYREQDSQCAYSQTMLDINRLFEDGYAEIDHALPYSRSFDDGMNNKVLVHTKYNRDKGNRTPYEFMHGAGNSEQWQRFVAYVESNKKYRLAKRQRLLRKDFGTEEAEKFRERNLTDTRYASRVFKNLIEQHLQLAETSNSKRCAVVSGQLTSLLRARWGLIKVRDEGDTHHALDAAVVAAASHGMIKRMSDYARRKELDQVRADYVNPETGEVLNLEVLRQLESHFPVPWHGFREQLLEQLKTIRVSRAPLRRGLGQAHQETIRSAKRLAENLSSVKTPVTNLKFSDLPNIAGYHDPRDAAWIEELRKRLEPFKDEDKKQNSCAGKKAFAPGQPPLFKPSAAGKTAPPVRSVKLLDTQKSGLPVRGGIANNGSMLRVDIFTKGGKFYAVPLYVADAVKKELPNKAVVQAKPESEWPSMDNTFQFLFSLHPNDWVKVSYKNDPAKEGYFSGLNRATAAIDIWAHDRNQSIGKNGLMQSIGIKTALSVEKFHVDLLGNLHKVHVETRHPLYLKRK